jgi:hypothetical protein
MSLGALGTVLQAVLPDVVRMFARAASCSVAETSVIVYRRVKGGLFCKER